MAMGRLPEEDFESEGIISEINTTPLTDIFLVLLIIFMVTSTALVQQALQVNLPQSSSGQAVPKAVTLTLTPDEKIFLDGKFIPSRDALPGRLRAALAETSDKLVILEGDERVLLGQVVELLDLARKAGARKVAIATKPPEGR